VQLPHIALLVAREPGGGDAPQPLAALLVRAFSAFNFDNTGDFVTGYAVVNPGAVACELSIEAFDEAGNRLLPQGAPVTIRLPGKGHRAFVSRTLIPQLDEKRGTLVFGKLVGDPGGCAHGSIGLRFDPTGLFTYFLHSGEALQKGMLS
jgi:hypothetical protein